MKPETLVYINSNNEKETRLLVEAIEAKRGQVEELTVTREHLKAEVDLFQHRYNAHIGHYYKELDKVELETKEYQLRLQLRREAVNEAEIEARVESCFRVNRARLAAYEEKAEEAPKPEEPELPEEKAKYLQTLYRKLAKRYHPDKSADTDEQQRREELMPLINRAYQEQDIQILERLSIGEAVAAMSPDETGTEKYAKLQVELRNLNRAASELRLEISRLKSGRTYQLKQQVEDAKTNGVDLLTHLAKNLERKVRSGQAQLTRLMNMWNRPKRS